MIWNVIWSILLLGNLGLLVFVLNRLSLIARAQTQPDEQSQLSSLHEEVSKSEQEIRSEVRTTQESTTKTLVVNIGELSKTLTTQLDGVRTTLVTTIGKLGEAQSRELTSSTEAINTLTQSNESSIENVRAAVNKRLQAMQDSNEKKLDQMRQTVDEQLQTTLEKRLTNSFNIISERLEAVQHGLGTMQNLAENVGNLQHVLTNVSARGAWGEVQLGAILEQTLAPNQYSQNVQPHTGSETVEYAVHLPDNNNPGSYIWLPIDSKFPMADHRRFLDAAERADKDAEKKAIQALIRTVQNEAKKIEKYIAPPHTTEFAIMFLPTEGLYTEVLRHPDLVEKLLQGNHKIIVAGPTTLAAILLSYRAGFQTLAIQKHSSKIQEMFAAIKTEFGVFNNTLGLTQRHLRNASNALKKTEERSHAVVGKLREVETISPEEAAKMLELPEAEIENELSEEST